MVGRESSDSAIYSNRDTQAAWTYHTATNHTWHSVSTSSHYMDWNNQPRPFKIYPDLPAQRLPTDFPSSGMSGLDSLTGSAPMKSGEFGELTLENLAGLLYYSAGVTKGIEASGGRMFFRAAACTGALYHIELYLVCGDLPGLEAGVYQFGAHDFALRLLREGDFRGVLAEASGGEPSVADAPAVIVTTSVYWRNSWKYQERAYRHCYWDSGVILANLLAMGNAYKLPLKVVASFADGPVNRLLDLDEQREVALQLVPVGRSPQTPAARAGDVGPLNLKVEPYSRREVDYPAIREMHAASSLASPEEARRLRGSPPPLRDPEPLGRLIPLDLSPAEELPQDTIEEVIIRRGSSRRFRRASISYPQLSTMLDRATRGVGADFLEGPDAAQSPRDVPTLNQLYLIVNDVDGLAAGSYVFHRDRGVLEQLQAGEMRETAGRLDLGQELAADAGVNVYFLTDLNAVLERYGNRGYRMAQMEASTMGGRLYLGAYAQRLGATGLTFFDDEVTEFFSPHAEGKSVMFLVAVGRPVRRRR